MRHLSSLLVLAGLLGCSAFAAMPIAMRDIAKGKSTELGRANEFIVARSAAEFDAAMRGKVTHVSEKSPSQLLAAVDFDKEIVLGVSLSSKPDSCTGVTIQSVIEEAAGLTVHYQELKPAAGDVCLTTLYAPFDFVVIAKTRGPIRFLEDATP